MGYEGESLEITPGEVRIAAERVTPEIIELEATVEGGLVANFR
jgi:hypothetical protein